MNSVNKALYIPLYGKSYVSKLYAGGFSKKLYRLFEYAKN